MKPLVPLISLGALLPSACAFGQADSIFAKLADRDARASKLTFAWNLEERRRLYANPDSSAPNEGGITFRQDDSQWAFDTPFVFARSGDLTVTDGKFSVYNSVERKPEFLRLVTMYGDGWLGCVRYDAANEPTKARTAEFSGASKNGLRSFNALDTSGMLWPQEFVFLCGISPQGVYGVDWTYEKTANGFVFIGRNYDASDKILNTNLRNHWEFKVFYDPVKLSPTRIEAYQEFRLEHVTTIVSHRKVGPDWFPAEVLFRHKLGNPARPISEKLRRWTLTNVKETANLDIPVPKGTGVGDYRLVAKDLYIAAFPPKGAKPVQYRWNGKLPTLDELRRMRSPDTALTGSPFNPSLLIPPAALILVGLIGFTRGNRTRRPKTSV